MVVVPEFLFFCSVKGQSVDCIAAGASHGTEAIVATQPDDATHPRRHLLAGSVLLNIALAINTGFASPVEPGIQISQLGHVVGWLDVFYWPRRVGLSEMAAQHLFEVQ